MKTTKILCPRCRVGWIAHKHCSQCGQKVSTPEERQERMGRLVRNSLIGVVSVLAGIWLTYLL
jgi:hypothetical protein